MKYTTPTTAESADISSRGNAPKRKPSYQELLDESLRETFPASDPISPGSAANAERDEQERRERATPAPRPGRSS